MIRIRAATESDFAAILNVQQAAFGEYATVYEVSAWTTETHIRSGSGERHYRIGALLDSRWRLRDPVVIRKSRESETWSGESVDTGNRTAHD